MAQASNSNMHPKTSLVVGLSVLAAFLLVVANSAFWFNKYIFSQDQFTKIATSALQSESSRQALAAEISDRLFANRPLLSRAIEEPAAKLISGLLGSNLANKAYTRVVDRLHTTMTSPNPQDITIDLTSIKQIATRVVAALGAESSEPAVQVQDLPDSITILQASRVPNIYGLGITMLWIAPLATIVSLGLLAYLIYAARRSLERIRSALAIEGLIVAAGGLLALLVGPLLKPLLLANVQSANMQTLAGNIYSAFIATYNQQTIVIFVLALVLLLSALGFWISRPLVNWLRTTRRNSNTKSTP